MSEQRYIVHRKRGKPWVFTEDENGTPVHVSREGNRYELRVGDLGAFKPVWIARLHDGSGVWSNVWTTDEVRIGATHVEFPNGGVYYFPGNREQQTEWISDKGDVFTVEECCGEDGCVVIKRWLTRDPAGVEENARLMAAHTDLTYEQALLMERARYDDPADDLHIPRDVLPNIIAALQRLQDDMPKEATDHA